MILGDLLIKSARKYPEKNALIFEGGKYSFAQLNSRVNRLANALSDMGVKKGDRIAVLARNCPEYIELYFAAAKGGMTIVPLNYRLVGRELSYIVNDSEATTLFLEQDYLPVIDSIRTQLGAAQNFILIGQEMSDIKDYEELISNYPSNEPMTRVDEDDLISLMYTSGTTGLPKGVMITHKNLLANAMNSIMELQIAPSDITLIVIPLFHTAGVWPFLTHVYMGATTVLLEKFEPKATLDTIEREKVTNCNLVPTILASLLNCPDVERHNYSSLRCIVYGASPIPIGTLQRALRVFGNILVQVYGLTEASPLLTVLSKEDHVLQGPQVTRLRSCGREMLNVEVKVVDDEGKDVAPGQVGEVIAKGDNIMKGYWQQSQATAETIKDGYLYTGDLAICDEEGYLYIVDRKKDMIISGGENIYSKEVEDVLCSHSSVLEAAVIGVPDKKWGELVKAFVVLKEGEDATEEELIEFCKQNLASYKKPQSVEFITELPRNPIGKVVKGILREKYLLKGAGKRGSLNG